MSPNTYSHPLSYSVSKQWCKYATIIYLCHSCDSLSRHNLFHSSPKSNKYTHAHTHTKMPQVSEQIALLRHTQSAGSYLQFGGGSKVISASSFWILKQEEDVCYNHTIIQTHAHTLLYKSCQWKSIFECAHWIPHWFSNELLSYVTVLSRKINMEMYSGIFTTLFKLR